MVGLGNTGAKEGGSKPQPRVPLEYNHDATDVGDSGATSLCDDESALTMTQFYRNLHHSTMSYLATLSSLWIREESDSEAAVWRVVAALVEVVGWSISKLLYVALTELTPYDGYSVVSR